MCDSSAIYARAQGGEIQVQGLGVVLRLRRLAAVLLRDARGWTRAEGHTHTHTVNRPV